MESYSLLTLNTSALGQVSLNDSRSSSNPLLNFLDKLPNHISNDINSLNSVVGEVASELGIEDWYSMHLLDYCEGSYTPAAAPNATLKAKNIKKNTTECSKAKAMYKFDPTDIIQNALNQKTGGSVTLSDLDWPSDIEKGIHTLNAIMDAMFILYVIAICLIFISFVAAVFAILTSGRLSACINFMIAVLAFLAIGFASALTTAAMCKVVNLIHKYGKGIGLNAYKGNKFLALTWAATGLMLVVILVWIVEFCRGRRHHKRAAYGDAKHG